MHLEGFQDVLVIITYGLAILILSIVADRKNRNPLVWGLLGGLFFPCSLIYLAFLPGLPARFGLAKRLGSGRSDRKQQMDRLFAARRESGLPVTTRRHAVFEAIRDHTDHPTAEEQIL
jgi:hypothetical protein